MKEERRYDQKKKRRKKKIHGSSKKMLTPMLPITDSRFAHLWSCRIEFKFQANVMKRAAHIDSMVRNTERINMVRAYDFHANERGTYLHIICAHIQHDGNLHTVQCIYLSYHDGAWLINSIPDRRRFVFVHKIIMKRSPHIYSLRLIFVSKLESRTTSLHSFASRVRVRVHHGWCCCGAHPMWPIGWVSGARSLRRICVCIQII